MEHGPDLGSGDHLTLIDRRLETPDVLHGDAVRLARLEILVQGGEDLVVEDLKLADAVDQALDWDVGYRLVLAVNSLNA